MENNYYNSSIRQQYPTLTSYEVKTYKNGNLYLILPHSWSLCEHIDNVNEIIKEEYGELYEVEKYSQDEKLQSFILITNLPIENYVGRICESGKIDKNYLDQKGWLLEKKLISIWEIISEQKSIFSNSADDFTNPYGIDKNEVKKFFTDYIAYLQELYDNSIPRKYGKKIVLEDFNTKETLMEYYEILRNYKKVSCPFTKMSIDSYLVIHDNIIQENLEIIDEPKVEIKINVLLQQLEQKGVHFTPQSKIGEVYRKLFKSEKEKVRFRKETTFKILWKSLQDGGNYKKVVGNDNLTVRSRLFEILAILMGCEYNKVQEISENKGEFSLW